MIQEALLTVSPEKLPAEEPVGKLEVVAEFQGAMPTGVTVSHKGRIFVNFPKWGDAVPFTVGEVRDGRCTAFPDEDINQTSAAHQADTLVSVQSVVVDPSDRLWILDTGSPMFKPPQYGGPKLICVDLTSNRVVRKILFPVEVALPTTYLNDVRFDLRRGAAGMAFITDSSEKGPNGIITVDLDSGESWRRLEHDLSTQPEGIEKFLPLVEGRPFVQRDKDGAFKPAASMGSDGIAMGAGGTRLYYCPLASRQLYSVAADALADRLAESEVAATVIYEGDKGGASDGLESDAAGHIYATNYEHNAILRRRPNKKWETIVHDPRLLWPDTLSLAMDGYLYVTANQLHRQARFQGGHDLRRKPYALFRVRVDERPVLLT